MKEFPNINAFWGYLIVEELIRNGINYFCLSPGSRSTPLIAAVAGHPRARSVILYDERSAAFHALGYARAGGKPAALICTSGTAAANYLPAVVEAAQDRMPLLVISADRPPELRDTGANQTIRQPGLFGHYVRGEFDLPCPDERIPPEVVLTTVDHLVHQAGHSPAGSTHSGMAGPVHLNCMFREPLAPEPQAFTAPKSGAFLRWQQDNRPYTTYAPVRTIPESLALEAAAEILRQTRRGVLLAGRLASPVEAEAVLALAKRLNWPVFPDVLSGLRLGTGDAPIIPYFDQLLLSERFRKAFAPETVLHIGGVPVSKRLLQWIESSPPSHYILVHRHPHREDPMHRVTLRLEGDIPAACEALGNRVGEAAEPGWGRGLGDCSRQVEALVHAAVDAGKELTEIAVARIITRHIPGDHALVLASSMPIREVDMYGVSGGAGVPVFANRGASGIDGTLATATGIAVGGQRPVTLLIGDLALLHDLNSLSILSRLSRPVVIVALNNHGGGIFSFLPIAQFENIFEPFFGTPHEFTFAGAAEMFGVPYFAPQTLPEFERIYREAAASGKSALVEVSTDRRRNAALHRELQENIVRCIEKVLT